MSKNSEEKAYAVIETGGKQYLVKAKDVLQVELIDAKEGDTVKIQPVLAKSDGTKLETGRPAIEGASVACRILKHIRGEKVVAFKKKRRKGLRRKIGHRQELTVLQVESI